MNLSELSGLINGKFLNNTKPSIKEIKGAFAADLMSDVLATIQPHAVLITGLCNPQVVRTAVMADVTAIVIVRGKQPPQETIDLADEESIPIISTPLGMFEVCGKLYVAGVSSLEQVVQPDDCDCG